MVRRQRKALYGAVDKATTWVMPRFVGTMGVASSKPCSYCRLFMATISLLLCSLAPSRFNLHPCRGMEPSLDDDMATRWLLVIGLAGSTATPGRGGVRESEPGT